MYDKAEYAVMERAFQTSISVEYQQLEIIRELHRMWGVEFREF